ncbi:NnrS family protein [Achromobacter sp. F4_2707]|uniref:NnrS family protein n=1 Tax=Achromobacter sp. F4_2707 TaxID=3114286 RepID=UPI0039C5DA1D
MKTPLLDLRSGLRGEWPVFMCGFRPFFVLTAASAVVMMAMWLLMLRGLMPDVMPGGSMLWHSHEMIFGFVTASIAGFVLTAIPEFTHTAPVSHRRLARLAMLWVAARLAYALSGLWPAWLGLWPAALFNLAIVCVGLCSLAEFSLGDNLITGWTALAAAAAMLNLLNDWHVGRPLFNRWALMMYAFYWLVAVGYGLMGAAWLGAPLLPSAGRHVLMAGAMGLSIFTIMAMVGRIHAGLWLDRRIWLPLTAMTLVLATLLRAIAGFYAAAWTATLLLVSGMMWAACFATYLLVTWPVLTGPRSDGLVGCQEPMQRDAGHTADKIS